jgi:hypothetical protein
MTINKPLLGVAALVIVACAGGWVFFSDRNSPAPAPAPAVAPVRAPEPVPTPAPAEHPLPAGEDAAAAPLPQLNDSDASIAEALRTLLGAEAVQNYLRPDNVIRHLVATIDNLPRQKVAVEKRPATEVPGSFLADGDELHATLDRRNFDRYKPVVAVVRNIDVPTLVRIYIHFYPLFQQAYQDLGYPNGYFNDRLVQVIDLLVATPTPSEPIELVRPNVMYLFADPALEARPAGQKLLMRMGPENAATIKAKLLELRAALTAAPPKR